jgi:hypothetical protein
MASALLRVQVEGGPTMRKLLMSVLTVMAIATLTAGCVMVTKGPGDKTDTSVTGVFTSDRDVRANADATGTHFFPAMYSKGTGVQGLDWGW